MGIMLIRKAMRSSPMTHPHGGVGNPKLFQSLSEPDENVVRVIGGLKGDLLVLGAGGKIGHGLALMSRRAMSSAGRRCRVIAVSRFNDPAVRKTFEDDGIDTIACDLTDEEAVKCLPDASAIFYLAGQKFGSAANRALTWILNCYVPAVVAQRWPDSRIAYYSSGNVYPFTTPDSGGPTEDYPPGPIGEYAQSVLGRERVFEHFSRVQGTKMTCIRLNYACEPRYGVLVDLAERILAGRAIDLSQSYVNLVWQSDCNRVTIKCLELANSPPTIMNLAGPQCSVRKLAERLGLALGKRPTFVGQPAPTSLLSNGGRCWETFGPPSVTVDQMIRRVADWLVAGGKTFGKPTHFEVRNGEF